MNSDYSHPLPTFIFLPPLLIPSNTIRRNSLPQTVGGII